VSAKASGLGMFSTKQLSLDHRHTADTRAQSHHNDFGGAPCRTGIALAKQSHSSVVFDTEWQAKSFLAPGGKIDFWSIFILRVGREHAAHTGIDEPWESHSNSFTVCE